MLIQKNNFTASEMVAIQRVARKTMDISGSTFPLFHYPVTFKRHDDGTQLRNLLSSNFNSPSHGDIFSRLVYVKREYDGCETYEWITDIIPLHYDEVTNELHKSFPKGGIFNHA